jgi:autotransporter-associated beta strand protein
MKSKSAFRLVRNGSSAACILAAALAALLAAPPAHAAITDTWQNGGDLLWSNTGNWSAGVLPDTGDTADFTGTNIGAVDLGATTRTFGTLRASNLGYTFTNGTLSLNAITTAVDGRPSYLVISPAVTDAGGIGLTINKHNGDGGYVNISGQITISSTAANAFHVAPIGSNYGALKFGSTSAINSVAGGVLVADWTGGSSEDFNGEWTVGGDFNVARATGGRNDVTMNPVNLLGMVTISGKLQNASLCGTAAPLVIGSASTVSVGGDLIVTARSSNDITINKALASLGGSVKVLNGILKLNVTDPIPSTTQAFLLGDTSGTLAAQIEIDTNAKTLNNPVTVQSGSGGAATLYSGATGTTLTNKVTCAGTITLNKGLNINANNGANRILDVTGQISGAGYVAINTGNQVGTVLLSNTANNYSGGTLVNAGILQYNDAGAIAGTGRNVTLNAAATLVFGSSFVDTNIPAALARIVTTSTGAIAADNYGATDFNFNTAGLTAASLGAVGSVTYTGTLTPNGTTYRLGGGGGTLVFTPGGGIFDNTTDLVINGNGLTGTVDFGGLTKTFGAITVAGGILQNGTLNCTSYALQGGTVTATLNNGAGASALTKTGAGTLTFNGTTAQTFTGGLIINAGTVAENFANFTADPNSNLLDSANVLTLGGGTLSLTGKNNVASLQTFASTTMSANRGSKITLARTGSGTMTVDLKAITRNTGSTLNFTNVPDTGTIIATTTTPNTNDILGPWATVGVGSGNSGAAVFYATVNGSNQIVSYTGATALNTALTDLSDMASATTNYSFATTAATTLTLAGPVTGNTLRLPSTAAQGVAPLTINTNGSNLTLNGLLESATNAYNNVTITRTAGAGSLMIGAGKDLVFISGGKQAFNINAPIVDYDPGTGAEASALTYNGYVADNDFALNLKVASTYTGGTTINSGRVNLDNAAGFGIGGSVTANSGVYLSSNSGSTVANPLTLNGATLYAGGGWTGPITLAANSAVDGGYYAGGFGNNGMIRGNISGPGGLTKSGSNTIMLAGATNSYTGPTSITAGGLQFASSLYSNDTAQWTPANISVNSGCTLKLSVGGTGQFTGAQAGTLITNLTTNVNNNGMKAGSTFAVDPSDAGATPVEISANITDSVGPGGGQVNFQIGQRDGAPGNSTVVLSGASTYSGQTSIDRYMAVNLSVSSFNSVATNPTLGTVHSASSNLGAPTTVANGTINLLNEVRNVALIYTGGGETTDRVINYASGSGNLTLDQSGNGPLKFVSSITAGNTGRSLTLRGSTESGTGEIAAAIGTNFGGGVTKTGSGTWTLSGANNTYAGTTTVSQGTLLINGTNSGAGAVNVNSTGTLGGTGSIAGAVTVNNGGTLAPGASTGALSVASATFNATSTFAIQIDDSASPNPKVDTLNVTNALNINGAALNITVTGSATQTVYVIASYGSLTSPGAFASITATGITIPDDYTIDYNYNGEKKIALVKVGGSDYDTWAGPSGYNLAGGPDVDDDGDGLSNFEEYAFGLNPTSGASVNPISQQLDKTTGLFKYTRRATPLTTGVTYSYESSTTLGGWPGFAPDSTVSNNATPVEEITVKVPNALLANPSLFVRVKAVPAP